MAVAGSPALGQVTWGILSCREDGLQGGPCVEAEWVPYLTARGNCQGAFENCRFPDSCEAN